ncbi:MAG: acyl-CoA dehydrogenase family protein, partial [Anaerolineales bacterium]|nr:acyl-CoA dehydrogenase family protein [Anaerolineales bacterium]
MQEHLLTEEHRMFRDAFRKFAEREIVPHQEQWEKDGIVSREVWQKAGAAGFLCMDVPEEYGGLGVKDYRYHVIVAEELARVGEAGAGFALHTDMIVPYITNFGSEAQKARWLPGLVSGELIASVA